MRCCGILMLVVLAHALSIHQGCSVLTEQGCRLCRREFVMTHSYLCVKPTACRLSSLRNECATYRHSAGCTVQGGSCLGFEQDNKKEEIHGCLQYSEEGCVSCESSHQQSEGVCIVANCEERRTDICQKCTEGFEVTQRGYCSQISKRIPHCLDVAASLCVRCAVDYWAVHGVCFPKRKGCIYKTNEGCTSCLPGYSRSNSTCWMDGCLDFHQNGQCEHCYYPFVKHGDGLCKIYFCAKVANKTCVKCEEGSRMDPEGRCFQTDNNCARYSQSSSRCEECAAHYFPEGSRCLHYDSNCLQFESANLCVACNRMYYLNQHQICRIRDRKCIVYINGFCVQCISGFRLFKGVCKNKFKEAEYRDCEAVLQHGGGYLFSSEPNQLIIKLDYLRSLCGFEVSDKGSSNLTFLDVYFSRDNKMYRKVGRFSAPLSLKGYVQIHKFYKRMEAAYFKIVSNGEGNLQVDLYVETYRRVKESRAYLPGKSLVEAGNHFCAMVTCGQELSCMTTVQSTRLLSLASLRINFQLSPPVQPMFLLNYSLDGHEFVCVNGCVPIAQSDFPQLWFQQLQMRLVNGTGSCWGVTLQ